MATCKNCGKVISDMLRDYGFCSYNCNSAYSAASTTSPSSTSPTSIPPNSTSPSTAPTIDPVTGLEVPRTLVHDTYKGHKLSVKPGEVDTVSSYLNKTLLNDLILMAEKIDESKTRVENKANENPAVGVPGSYSVAYDNASKAITTAIDDVQEAVNKIRNIADAICQYGDGGWATPYSVLKHLNDFIYSGGGPGGNPDGGSPSFGDDNLVPSETDSTIPIGSTDGSESGGNLNTFDEEIVISEIASSNNDSSGNGVIVPTVDDLDDDNLEVDSDVGNSALSGFSSFTVPNSNKDRIDGTKSAGVLGSLGLVAAAAVAVGAKIYRDKNEELNEEESEFNDNYLDVGISNVIPYSSNREMLKMKKKIFNIGGDE